MRNMLFSAALAALAGTSGAMATNFPGPDPFGYGGAAIPFNFTDISTTGTPAFGTQVDDVVTNAKPIGFTFSFYGQSYTEAYIGSNGFITFSPGQSHGCCGGAPLPTANGSPSNLIAGWWTDLVSNPGVGTNILYETLGAPGSRMFVVQYLENPYYSNFYSSVGNSFEIILHETTNAISLQYLHTLADGHIRSVGIQNQDGLVGLQLLHDATTLFANQGFCISAGGTSCPVPAAAPVEVPEPMSSALLGLGLLGFGMLRRSFPRERLSAGGK